MKRFEDLMELVFKFGESARDYATLSDEYLDEYLDEWESWAFAYYEDSWQIDLGFDWSEDNEIIFDLEGGYAGHDGEDGYYEATPQELEAFTEALGDLVRRLDREHKWGKYRRA